MGVTSADDEVARRGLIAGDPSALESVTTKYWKRAVAYAWRLTDDRDVAEDVSQLTFVRLWEGRSRLDPRGSLEPLIFRMVRNASLDYARRRSVRARHAKAHPEGGSVRTPADMLEADELRLAVNHAINELPTVRREVFLLARHSGLTHREIADLLGLAPQTVANHLHLALNDLRARLAHLLPPDYAPKPDR